MNIKCEFCGVTINPVANTHVCQDLNSTLTSNGNVTPTYLNPRQFSTGANPPAHQGSKWQTDTDENSVKVPTFQAIYDKHTVSEIPKCKDCGQPMLVVARPCLNCGDLLYQCPECKEVKIAFVKPL